MKITDTLQSENYGEQEKKSLRGLEIVLKNTWRKIVFVDPNSSYFNLFLFGFSICFCFLPILKIRNSCGRECFVENSILLKNDFWQKQNPQLWFKEAEDTTYQEEHIPLSAPRNWDIGLHIFLNT